MPQIAAAMAAEPSYVGGWLRLMRRRPAFAFGMACLAFILLVACVPTLFTARSPYAIDVANALQGPGGEHLFGTDDTGRDILARVVFGTRITLTICAGALLIAACLGGIVGAVSGFFGGWIDQLLGRLVDVLSSFPPIVLGVIITGVLGPVTFNLVLALSIIHVPAFFRIARSGALAETGKTYVEAARSLGLTELAVFRRHVLPNVAPLILVQYMIMFPLVLQIQAALGFLGLGVQPPAPDWGAILQQGKDSILLAPWISLFPGLAVLVTAFVLMLIGRALQSDADRR
jgi:ABC-type dipeptide/oligopeptide/nickel transport system permease subunit